MMSNNKGQADDPYGLARFMAAQESTYQRAYREIVAASKDSHWMWFVFPQITGLGSSHMARRYAISGLAEAAAYLEHPVLGPRLLECCEALLRIEGSSAREILGSPDDLKLRSSMTLFSQIEKSKAVCQAVIKKYFGGEPDDRTLQILTAMESGG